MPCVVILLLLGLPRLALFALWLWSDYLGRAFSGTSQLWPILGFLFMPFTTLAYAFSMNTWGEIRGLGTVAVIIAVLVDLGALGASRRKRSAS
ncbi:MAG TPA: hypothetical protein VMV01_19615 [Planctomycetota bacterium]|jgi:hypothetical protein|nr:hypothetical protein [Planctomycetota bacterium]HZJ71969.1 hypothetical protein [Planctomycetota bacterium]